ncbi:MAG: DUF3298 domain-containing protein, partial [Clostridiales bacterium]|nr:DUF3298 domain-containing protein [Clostridiales bacterium]
MKKFMKKTGVLAMAVMLLFAPSAVSASLAGSASHRVTRAAGERLALQIVTPYFDGFPGAETVNRLLRDLTLDAAGEANATARTLAEAEGEASCVTLDICYDYNTSGDLLSVWLTADYYAGGAHPLRWLNAVTLNTATGEVYGCNDLLQGGADALTEQIIAAIDENPEEYFENYAEVVRAKNGDFRFYVDGDRLIVYFDLYEIAPYATGLRRFAFDASALDGLLADGIAEAVNGGKPLGAARFNGKDAELPNGASVKTAYIGADGAVMVPLRQTAEALGYTVGWNESDGAILAQGFTAGAVSFVQEGGAAYSAFGTP